MTVHHLADEPRGLGLDQLVLTVTQRCNQRCDYCYVPRGSTRSMSMDVASRALDFFFDHASGAKKLSLAFFGGEPLLEPGLLRRISEEALRRAGSRRLELSATTNGTALDDEGLEVVRQLGLKLAVSHDGACGHGARRLASGEPSLALLRRNLPKLRAIEGAVALARMTVTPRSVPMLADDLRSVLEDGLSAVQYLPAFEADWDDLAVRRWTDEHHRLVTWLVGRKGTGAPCPTLPQWRGILGRLGGKPRRHCGAASRRIAVSVDGTLHPCYRTVFEPAGSRLALGDVWAGITRPEVQTALAGLDPTHVHPQEGDCGTCAARSGCGFFCPALGELLLGDPLAVPRSACALTRGQVEACERLMGTATRQARRPVGVWAAALAAAFLGSFAPGCSRSVGGAGVDAGDGGLPDALVDGRADVEVERDVGVPGICPMILDSGLDAEPDSGCDPGYGGIC
jgi:uncharacterized protein